MWIIVRFFMKLIGLCISLGMMVAIVLVFYYTRELPDYHEITKYKPALVTRMYTSDGRLLEEYARERRIFVGIADTPKILINAFLAAEDKNFYDHPGIDVMSIARASVANVKRFMQHKRMEGGSTITQQVVKNFLLTSERSIARKVKEAVLSYIITKKFTKDQILELYLNQQFFGRGSYGIVAAAQTYFNKNLNDLTIEEVAFLAGLPKGPALFDPDKHPERAKSRRDYVLTRMMEDGHIAQAVAMKAMSSEIVLRKRDKNRTYSADYFAECVRNEVIAMYGEDAFYTAGLSIITTVDVELQKHAQNALRYGLVKYDRSRGYRGAYKKIDLSNWQENLQNVVNDPSMPSMVEGVIAVVVLSNDGRTIECGGINGERYKLGLKSFEWINAKVAKEKLTKGSVIFLSKNETRGDKNPLDYEVYQIPAVNGGVLVMDPTDGRVLAHVGGYNFGDSKFDRVTQAQRQSGSIVKPFVYLSALEHDIPPNKLYDDGPISLSQGEGMPRWSPKNFGGDFLGEITMRSGLEKSRNLVTVRVANDVGIGSVAEIIKRYGINDNPRRFYSMVLGSLETTLQRMTTAYAMVANGGYKIQPQHIEMIYDSYGNVVYKRQNYARYDGEDLVPYNCERITDPESNYQLISILEGVTLRGTAASAHRLNGVIAGKTGTTNDSKDVWFMGFTPNMIVGTYIGYDMPKDMGKKTSGSSTALPVFINFMEKALVLRPSQVAFPVPTGIAIQTIDKLTGGECIPGEGGKCIAEAFKMAGYTGQRERLENDIFNLDNSVEVEATSAEVEKTDDATSVGATDSNIDIFTSLEEETGERVQD